MFDSARNLHGSAAAPGKMAWKKVPSRILNIGRYCRFQLK